MPENKGLDRGGALGQEGELSPEGGSPASDGDAGDVTPPNRRPRGSVHDRLDWRDQQKQRRGIDREPDLDD